MFQFFTIEHYHKQLREGKTSCREVVEYYLDRIEKNKDLNAFVEVFVEEARKKAAELDKKREQNPVLKPLHGVVIAIKDVICFKDHKLSAGSAILKNFTSLYTASALQYLLDEDVIVIGNCNCDEFAMGSTNENSVYGPVKNAADTTRVPGGSSGGSAVAVQANLCMLSLGSDTGGSVRQPADFCGIIGFKPSYGSISRYGLVAYASSFDQIGIFGKTVEDVSLIWKIMNSPDKKDSTMTLQKLITGKQTEKKKYKLAVFKQAMNHAALDKEIADSLQRALNHLDKNFFSVSEEQLELFDFIVPAYYVLTTAEASSNLARYDGIRYGGTAGEEKELDNFYNRNRTEGFGMEVKRRIMLGTFVLSTGYYDAYYAKAQQVRRLLVNKLENIFNEYDAIVMPVSPNTAYKLGEQKDPVSTYLADIYTVLANLTGVPAIALPLFSHSNNMPFGLQVLAKKQDEVTLLAIADLLIKQLAEVEKI